MKYLFMLAAIVALSSCSKPAAKKTVHTSASDAPKPAAMMQNHIANVSAVAGVNPAQKGHATDFSWYNSDGEKMSLADFRGKTVLINFWATWCPPCKAELPDIEAISRQYSPKGLVVVGVSEDAGKNALRDVSNFTSQHGLTYQIVLDDNSIADAYGNINAIPTSFIVGKDGKILKSWVGERDREFFETTVKKYLD